MKLQFINQLRFHKRCGIFNEYRLKSEKMIPCVFYISQKSELSEDRIYWLEKNESYRRGIVKHQVVRLVEVEGEVNELAQKLFFDTSDVPFVAGLARGAYKDGYWALATGEMKKVEKIVCLYEGNLKIVGLSNLPRIERPGHTTRCGFHVAPHILVGMEDENRLVSSTQFRRWRIGEVSIYDHRPEYSDSAKVVWVEKKYEKKKWQHISLYRKDGEMEGSIVFSQAQLIPKEGREIGRCRIVNIEIERPWRRKAGRYVNFYIYILINRIRQVENKIAEFMKPFREYQNISVIADKCSMAEEIIVLAIESNLLEVDDGMDKLWNRYCAIKARAQRPGSEAEGKISWKKAIATLQKIINNIKRSEKK